MTDKILNLLGLALRGRNLAVGDEPVAQACRLNKARLLLTAADAANNTVSRAGRLANVGNVPMATLPCSKEQLGAALGRDVCAVLAVTDLGLAAALLERLAGEDERFRPLAQQLAEKPREKNDFRYREKACGRKSLTATHRNFRRWPV